MDPSQVKLSFFFIHYFYKYNPLSEMKKYTPEKKNKEEEHKSKKDSPNQNPKK